MTSIISIVTVFMATFLLVFGYLSFSEQYGTPAMETPAVSSTDS